MIDETEALLKRGAAAERLMRDEVFAGVMNELAEAHTQAMIRTPAGVPGEADRTHHHLLLTALREIADTLSLRITQAEQALRDLENPPEDFE
jgi:hypothetical protein